jgi:hypothetical protein
MTRFEEGSPASYDSILRRGLEPDSTAVARVARNALAARGRREPSLRLLGAAAALIALAVWAADRGRPPVLRTTLVSGPGGIVVVRTADGAFGFYQNAQPAQPRQVIIRQGGSS